MRVDVTRVGEPPDRDLTRVARDLTAAARTAARDVGKVARKQILDDVTARRGSLRMMGGRLGIRTRIDASASGSTVILLPTPAGAWSILEFGTRGYRIRPTRRAVLADRTIRGRAGVFGIEVNRRPMAGRQVWSRATDRLGAELDAAVAEPFDDLMSAT